MKVKIPTPGILLVLATSIIVLPVRGALATLVPVRNGEPFVTLLNFSLDPNFDANAPAPPVVTDTDNPIVAVYDSEANITWMSDQHLFQEQYNANVYFLSTLIGKRVTNPDGSRYIVTANDFWYDSSINRELASMSGVVAWIDSLNRNHYLGVSIWSLPRIADAQSLWNEVTASFFPNSTAGGVSCSTLISFGLTGCGYYDDNVGAFAYIVPTSWTSDVVGKAQGCWWNFATSEPRGSLTSCMVAGTAGPESTAIVPGYTGINQESAPGTNIENFSNPQAVVRCNVFRVKVPGRRDDCGRCR